MTYLADTENKRTHRTGYYLAFDGIPQRFSTHRFDALIYPTASTAHAWWPISETTNSASIEDALGNYPLNATGVGTPEPAPSFLQPSDDATGSRYFTADYDLRSVNSGALASEVIERGSVSAGFRPDTVTGTESIFAYSGTLASGNTAENPIVLLRQSGSEIQVIWRDSGANDIISTTSGAGLTIGVPYHVLVTWRTSGTTDLSLYLWQVGSGLVHEESFAGLAAPFGGSEADFVIGSARHQLTAQSYNGYLEDVVLWKIHHSRDRALAYLELASATFVPSLDISGISVSGSSLDRARSLVLPGGFSARVMDGEDQRRILSRRGGTLDTLAVSLNASANLVETAVSNNVSGRVVYLEKETILLGTVDGDDYLGSHRGAWGSQAISHGAGLVLSNRPRHLMGRRARLVAVDLDTLNSRTLQAGILSSSPQFSDGAYDLEFIDVQKELNRPLMRGFRPQISADYTVSGLTFNVLVNDATNFVDGDNSFVRLSADGFFAVYKLPTGTVDTANNLVQPLLATNVVYETTESSLRDETGTFPQIDIELQQVQIITQDPALAALQVMCSILGDGANGTYDVLPGRAASATDAARRVGAGIPQDWVDIEAWEALEGIGGTCRFFIEEETRLLDFLVDEVAWRLGGYVYVTNDGKISFRRYRATVPELEANTLDESKILAGSVSVVDDESEAVGRVSIECNYNYSEREYMHKHQVLFADLNGTYGDDLASIELQSKSLWVGNGGTSLNSPQTGQWEVISSFDRIYSRSKDGVRKLRFRLPWYLHTTYTPGHTFKLSDDRLPDLAGTVGISGRAHEVTSSSPDPQTGSVEVEAEEMPRGYLIAPSAVVIAYSAGVASLITLSDYHGTEPGFDFPVGATIRVFDADASPSFSVSETATIIAVTAGSIEFTLSTITPALGDLIVLEYNLSTSNTAQSTSAGVADHLYHGDTRSQLA